MTIPYGDLEPGMIFKLPQGMEVEQVIQERLRERAILKELGIPQPPTTFIPWSPPWYEIAFGWPVVFVWLALKLWKYKTNSPMKTP